MARLRFDYAEGVTTSAPLLVGDTSLASTEFADLPAVTAPDYIAITLSDGANYEIVHATHVAAATTVTLSARGAEGSTAREWPAGTAWDHGPTAADFPADGEPASPAEGQLWYDPNATVPAATAADIAVVDTAFANIVGTNAQAAFDSIDDQLGAAGSALTVQDENANVSTAVTQIDFQGAGVTTTAGTGEVIVTIPGGTGVTADTGIVATTETTTATTAADLTTSGPSATVTVGASGKVLVTVHTLAWNSTVGNGSNAWITLSGANTAAAASPYVVSGYSPSTSIGPSASGTFLFTGLAAGSTTFKMRYSVAAGTGSFSRRVITATAI